LLCPFCRAENSTDAIRCAKCGLAFPVIDEGETMVHGGASPAPSSRLPATASGVLSPPPGITPPGWGAGFSAPAYPGGSMVFEAGTDFGPRYRIEARLGEGGMGTVYKAYDRDLDRNVALKLLRPEMVADPASLQRFKQELLLASKISHKNILRIHDLGDVNGLKFISMALVEGEDMRGLLSREGRLAPERFVEMARQLCGALHAAHSEGVVHRDLKPHNVLVDAAGALFISDFGLAKSLDAGALAVTRTGEFLGTPRYMSPEQVEGGAITPRSDLYSLGILFYEMVTGEVPFTGDSTLQVMFKRVKEKPKDPRQLRPDLPDFIARIILKCLEKDPAHRYQDAAEILADLETQRAPARRWTLPDLHLSGARQWLSVTAAILMMAAYATSFLTRKAAAPGKTGSESAANIRYLAVLPFTLAADAASLGHVGNGLVDGLAGRLNQIGGLRVSARSAVERVNPADAPQKIGRTLGVGLLVRGSVHSAPGGIRVVVSLENSQTGERQWTQEFAGSAGDPLGLEDQVYQQLLTALAVKTTSEEMLRGTAHPTENLEAYDLYLRGRNSLRSLNDPKKVAEAVKFFDDALKKDSRFALAYAGLADAYLQMYREKKDALLSERALGAAQQAVKLDESLAEVHFSLGNVYTATGRSLEAVAAIRQALQFAPNSDEGYRRLGNALFLSNRRENAIPAYEKAVEINPYYWGNHNVLGDAYLQLGQSQKALAAFTRVTELEPESATGYENIGVVYLLLADYEKCIPALQKAAQLQPYYGTFSNLGTSYFYLKRYAEAVPMFEKAVELNPNQAVAVGNLADAYRWAGQKEKAARAYDSAIQLSVQDLRVNPRSAETMGNLALYYAKKGEGPRAAEFIRRARSLDTKDAGLAFKAAVVSWLGKKQDDALRALREALEADYPLNDVESDPELKDLRALPQYAALKSSIVGRAR
jgi:serine/threonine-protein kinase